MTLFFKNLLRVRGWLFAALLLALPGRGWATDAITNTYGFFNGSNNVPVIDAITWINHGTIEDILTTYPFDTTSTVNFENRGDITGQVGFRFDTVDEVKGTRRPMSVFNNRGNIVALDSPLQFFNPFFGNGGVLGFGSSTTPASWLLVNSSNIINPGTLAVGNVGLMRLNGKDIDLTRGTLVAGDVSNLNTNSLVSSANFFNVLGSSTGLGLISYFANSYVNPPQVYDLYWGSTPAGTQPLAPLAAQPPGSPSYKPDFVSFRANGGFTLFGFDLPVTFPADFDVSEFAYVNTGPNDAGGLPVQFGNTAGLTNYFFNFIFYKTNVSDPAITVTPRFAFASDYPVAANAVNGGVEAMVEFGTVTNDIGTGFPVTNAFYLLDNGAFQQSITVLTNASDENKVGRPSNLQITTATPFEWIFGDTNTDTFLSQYYLPYDSQDIFPGNFPLQGSYPAKAVDYTSGSYGVQVGRQPEFLNGLTVDSNLFTIASFTNLLVLSDPTNDAPRIEINATNLDLTSAYIRSEGVLNINAKHLRSGSPAGIDVGILNGDLGSTNGFLQISNVVSPTYKRVRGDVFAWSGNFNFTATNDVSTNNVHVHILVVDHALTAKFTPTFRNLALRGTSTLVQDNMRVINSALFQAKQLTFSSSVTLAQNAGSFGHQNAPLLTDFLIDTNGAFNVEGVAYVGADTTKGLNSFINRGLFTGFGILIKANYFENSGAILATNGSSVVIEGDVVNLIPSTVPTTLLPNTIMATRDVTISAGEVTAIGSTIVAGMNGSLGTLNLTATNSLTDNVPGIAGTNNVITNFWQTSDGIVVDRLPQDGGVDNDLFGTEIVCLSTNRNQSQIVWPAQDVGAGSDGFFNNLVVGHLVLDRQTSTSSIRFSAAGDQNAIYVDYLELRDFSFSDYRNGLVIDPNMTVYFAASNFEPDKLQAVFPGRLVWANSFTGPSSTKAVARRDGTTCLMNRSLAESQIIDMDNDGIVNAIDPFPLDNDSNPDFSLPCPGDTLTTSIRTFLTENYGSGSMTSLVVSVTGNGKVTPQQRSPVVQLGSSYTLHAVPTPGNLFADWSGSINTTQPNITFTMVSNTVLTARFVVNPFTTLKGSYNGLFYDTNNVNVDSAGSIVLNVTQQGSFYGSLTMTAGVVPFHGQFNADGNAATVIAARGKKSPLTLNLKLDTAGSQQVTGTIADDTNWTAIVVADHAVFGGRNVAPFAGNYTFTWQGNNDASASPGGDSYGTAFISRAGQVIPVIRLADGNTTTHVIPISKDGNWPLFKSLFGKEMLIGWVHVDSNSVMSGTVNWIKTPMTFGSYRAGFSNVVSLTGSVWVAPKNHSTGLNLTTPVITLSGGNLISDLAPALTFNANNLTFSSTNPSLSFRMIPSIGLFTGRFTDPATSRVRTFNGVMLQNQNNARGYFFGTDQSGAVRLDNP